MSSPPVPRAAVLLIGDELLSGKIRDENGWFLAQTLRRLGIRLVEMRTVADDLETIAAAAQALGRLAGVVFTSGGVGPTHDDKTLPAMALAVGRTLVRHPEIEQTLRHHYGESITEAALTMADVPEGTVLAGESGWPIMQLDAPIDGAPWPTTRFFVLPGIPTLLRRKVELLEQAAGALPVGRGWHLETVETTRAESDIAVILERALEAFPGVEIGSYPRWIPDEEGRLRVRVRVTIEAPSELADLAAGASAMISDALQDS